MAFTPRLTFSESELYTNKYFADGQKEWGAYKMPNCTCYAWCRFYEILGSWPTLSEGNAKDWWYYEKDGYARGQTPALGAVAVYDYPATPSKAGHVMIVEEIDANGDITTSQSGWGASSYFWTGKYYKSNNWEYGSARLLGFIYNPGAGTAGSPSGMSTVNKLQEFLDEAASHIG